MSFQDWKNNGWLRPHQASPQEIAALRAAIERDLKASSDANLNSDWRFAIAYNAALQCAALALYASGYEAPKGGGAHHRTLESLRPTLRDDGALVEPLPAFRAKRARAIYQTTGIAGDREIGELRALARNLLDRVLQWLQARHADLLASHPRGQGRRKHADGA
jgi:hypothetical protein